MLCYYWYAIQVKVKVLEYLCGQSKKSQSSASLWLAKCCATGPLSDRRSGLEIVVVVDFMDLVERVPLHIQISRVFPREISNYVLTLLYVNQGTNA